MGDDTWLELHEMLDFCVSSHPSDKRAQTSQTTQKFENTIEVRCGPKQLHTSESQSSAVEDWCFWGTMFSILRDQTRSWQTGTNNKTPGKNIAKARR